MQMLAKKGVNPRYRCPCPAAASGGGEAMGRGGEGKDGDRVVASLHTSRVAIRRERRGGLRRPPWVATAAALHA